MHIMRPYCIIFCKFYIRSSICCNISEEKIFLGTLMQLIFVGWSLNVDLKLISALTLLARSRTFLSVGATIPASLIQANAFGRTNTIDFIWSFFLPFTLGRNHLDV